MIGRFESLLLKPACLFVLLGISCPAPNAGLTLRFGSDIRVPVCTTISLQQLGQLIAAASTTKKFTHDPLVNRSSDQNETYKPLPEGYARYLNSNVAYKNYKTPVVWTEAKKLCEKEGARLVVADQETYTYLINLDKISRLHVGIHRIGDEWISIHDGSVVNNIPWAIGQPDSKFGCVGTQTWTGLLETIPCDKGIDARYRHYFCELPIPKNSL
ncbi:uncharacterized protein LOC124309494 [Neodiprion virginianus]|uniref:uncharacterized protein LOC124309494 n=1 Tax=Neodiprion virginianus TaxID=2961670 RepID=UPI001EE7080C|nr:uncharacterized protein LOC124309494 [Neodiprion virginianus]